MSTILVIDDEPVVRKLACQTLREAGYTCLEADTALAALEQLQSDPHRLDGMVVDIRLPDMSGLNLLRLARASIGLERRPSSSLAMPSPLQRSLNFSSFCKPSCQSHSHLISC